MSLQTELSTLATTIGTDTKKVKWVPPEPSVPVDGKSYAAFYSGGVWSGWAEVPAIPTLDTFIEGWQAFPWSLVTDIVQSGSLHVAASAGSSATPVIGTVTFDTSGGTGNFNIPFGGVTGTNWQLEDALDAPVPPTQGNNNAQIRTSPLSDLPDPSLGSVSGVSDLGLQSFRRNYYLTISGLTIGNRYYFSMLHGEPASYADTASLVAPDNGGASSLFGFDGPAGVISTGIRRYGFTATGTTISFLREGASTVGAYLLGFTVTDEGT